MAQHIVRSSSEELLSIISNERLAQWIATVSLSTTATRVGPMDHKILEYRVYMLYSLLGIVDNITKPLDLIDDMTREYVHVRSDSPCTIDEDESRREFVN